MKLIKIINTSLCAKVDDEDFELLARHIWHLVQKTGRSKTFYARSDRSNDPILMHQLILPSNNPNLIVDHKDGNGLNNQKSNLRNATYSQNNANSTRNKVNSSSKYRGVTQKYPGKFVAQISVNSKNIHLGYFKTEKAAAKAWNKAALQHFGEFAKLNQFKDELVN